MTGPGAGAPTAGVEAWLADLAADAEALSPAHYRLDLTEEERRRAAGYLNGEDARLFLRSRLAVRSLLAARLGEAPGAVRLGRTRGGKPYLPDHPELKVSWSRSEDLLLLGISEQGALGVDLERVRLIPAATQVLASVYPALPPQAELAGPEFFFSAWTLLEAAVKATGRGLAEGVGDVTLSFPAHGGAALLGIARTGGEPWAASTALLAAPAASGARLMASFVTRGRLGRVWLRRWPPEGADRDDRD
ncbi:phosphopantetheinyl transferase-like protein [Streptomyces tateyamensis]|uniref:Phosphopantetheinyl transferase-like protein n=1 Tax=Streptomyces tateyamensis TaxID=565073 RepID=A0A2V4N2P9_9ACTN|nr:4'-phosphopantetheinyl transferase superfamily protein [Streptomyces tateyamensis]PYC71885.1 phosphopantetheinyl transferase-like protein [Streptomyces tateyamensis]